MPPAALELEAVIGFSGALRVLAVRGVLGCCRVLLDAVFSVVSLSDLSLSAFFVY